MLSKRDFSYMLFLLWREAFCDLLLLCGGNEFSENLETLGFFVKITSFEE